MTFSNRKNHLLLQKEHWRSPAYFNNPGLLNKFKLWIYCFLDLQFATIRADLSDHLPKVKGAVLDVGCGIQPYRHLFTDKVRYLGIDTVDSKAHFGYETADTRYFSGPVWPVKNQTADFILCTETLEHVPEPSVFLKEAHRTLKPGGEILLTVPFAARWHFLPFDYWRFTPSGLDYLLKKAGFTHIRVFGRGNQLTVACYKMMAFIFTLLSPMNVPILLKGFSFLLGLLFLPVLFLAGLVAKLTKGIEGSVDCLGYTTLAERPARGMRKNGK